MYFCLSDSYCPFLEFFFFVVLNWENKNAPKPKPNTKVCKTVQKKQGNTYALQLNDSCIWGRDIIQISLHHKS